MYALAEHPGYLSRQQRFQRVSKTNSEENIKRSKEAKIFKQEMSNYVKANPVHRYGVPTPTLTSAIIANNVSTPPQDPDIIAPVGWQDEDQPGAGPVPAAKSISAPVLPTVEETLDGGRLDIRHVRGHQRGRRATVGFHQPLVSGRATNQARNKRKLERHLGSGMMGRKVRIRLRNTPRLRKD
jgi:hypothetical protein